MFEQSSYLGVATADWVAALKSSDPLERRLAAHALGEIGRTAREAVPALTEALRDPVSFVRVFFFFKQKTAYEISEVLGEDALHHEPALPFLPHEILRERI